MEMENRSVVAKGWGGEGLALQKPRVLVVMDLFYNLTVVVVAQLYTFIKKNRTVHHKGQILLYVNYTFKN